MKKLHLIGFTPGNDGLIVSPRKGAKSGGFVIPLDDALVSSIELARRRRDGEDVDDNGEGGSEAVGRGSPLRARSSLSPREIQARLRAGSTIGEVASQAGVDDEWVVRFAAPILAEQAQVVASAQVLTLVKARRGPSTEPLAPSVQWNLSDKGVLFSDDVFADSWSAYNLHGARWAVRFAYTHRKRRQIAEWEVDLRERSLVPRNRLATELGHVEEGRRRPSMDPADAGALEGAAATSTAPSPSAGRTARRAPAKKAASRPGTKVAGTTTAAAKSAAKRAGAKKAGVRKIAAARNSAKRAGATKVGGSRTAATARTVKKPAGTRSTAAAGGSGRQSSPRKRPAKKAASDTPGGTSPAGRSASPVPDAFPDRPSHLARPPSPMKMANRATSYPTQRLNATNARQAPMAPPAAPSQPRPKPVEPANPANPRFDLGPEPARKQGTGRPPAASAGQSRAPQERRAPASGQRPPAAAPAGRSAKVAATPAGPALASVPTRPAASAPVPPAPSRPAAAASVAPIPVAPPIGRRPMASRPGPAGTPGDERPAVVILSTPSRKSGRGPEDSEGQARLAAAERLRTALAGSPPTSGRSAGDGAPAARTGRANRRPAGS